MLAIKSEGASSDLVPITSREVARSRQAALWQYLTDYARMTIAEYARETFEDTDRANAAATGRHVTAVVAVDGRRNASIDQVKGDRGSITFEWEIVDDVLQWIWQALKDRSPVVSGDYRRGHNLFADGVLVTPGGAIPQASRYIFFNAVPYARKIEIGRTEGGRAFVIQVQNRIYERTAKDAKARFDNSARIDFEFIAPPDAYSLRRDQPSRAFLPGRVRRSPSIRADRRAGAAVTSPAIIVTMQGSAGPSSSTPLIAQSAQPLRLTDYSNG